MTTSELVEQKQTEADLDARVRAAAARLQTARAALPDPDRAPNLSPFGRRQLDEADGRLRSTESETGMTWSNYADLLPRKPDLVRWLDDLKAIRAEMCDDLVAINPNVLPTMQRTYAEQRQADIRLGILSLDRGPVYVGTAVNIGTVLPEKFAARGIVPMPGQGNVFNGRGSIETTERRIADLQDQIDAARARLDRALASVDAVVAFATEATATS